MSPANWRRCGTPSSATGSGVATSAACQLTWPRPAAYGDQLMTLEQCAAMFGVSRTTIMKFLAAEGVAQVVRQLGVGNTR